MKILNAGLSFYVTGLNVIVVVVVMAASPQASEYNCEQRSCHVWEAA